MKSAALRKLEKDVWALRMKYLPARFSPTGNYSPDQYTDTASFILAAHAGMESYIEQLAQDKISLLDRAIKAGKRPRAATVLLSSSFNQKQPACPANVLEIGDTSYREERLLDALNKVRIRAEANNGIRTKHVLPIFIPLGVDETKVDTNLLNDLDQFGKLRGDVAHNAQWNWPALPDPRDARNRAVSIVTGFTEFEALALEM